MIKDEFGREYDYLVSYVSQGALDNRFSRVFKRGVEQNLSHNGSKTVQKQDLLKEIITKLDSDIDSFEDKRESVSGIRSSAELQNFIEGQLVAIRRIKEYILSLGDKKNSPKA